jgi:hypothetical protein
MPGKLPSEGCVFARDCLGGSPVTESSDRCAAASDVALSCYLVASCGLGPVGRALRDLDFRTFRPGWALNFPIWALARPDLLLPFRSDNLGFGADGLSSGRRVYYWSCKLSMSSRRFLGYLFLVELLSAQAFPYLPSYIHLVLQAFWSSGSAVGYL